MRAAHRLGSMRRLELPLSWLAFAGLCLALGAASATGCRSRDLPPDAPPQKVADWLIDKLYVEVRQDQAIAATVGAAKDRIAAEQESVAAVRGGQAAVAARSAQVYWERLAAEENRFTYALTFKASGLRIEKEVRLELEETAAGIWRVSAIEEKDLSSSR